MHILVAVEVDDSAVDGPAAIEGEPVAVLRPCIDAWCGCRDTFVGLVSNGLVRRARVVEADITPEAHRLWNRWALMRDGWFRTDEEIEAAEELEAFEGLMRTHGDIAEQFPVGSVVEHQRKKDRLGYRLVRAARPHS